MISRWRGLVCSVAAGVALFATLAASPVLASIGVNKTFNPVSVSVGQTSTLTVILLNSNAAVATGVAFTDVLPGTVLIAPTPNLVNGCGGTLTGVAGSNNLSLAGASIPAAGGNPVSPGTCSVQVDVLSASAGVFVNNIPANSLASSQGSNPQSAVATLTVSALAAVTGTKTFAPTNVHGNGVASTVTLTLRNPNGIALTNASITDTLPATLAIAASPNVSTTCGPGVVSTGVASATLSGGTIPASSSCIVRFDVVAAAPNTFVNASATNSIAAGALTTAQGVTSAAISGAVTVQKGAQIAKAFVPNTIATGAVSTLTISISNFNASVLTPIALTDTFPANMVVAPTPNATTTCPGATVTAVALAGSFSVAGGSLAAAPVGPGSTSCTVSLSVQGNNAGANPVTLTNSIPAGNFGGVNYPASSSALIVNSATFITGSKVFAPAAAYQSTTTTLTITLNNSAAVAANITSFTDNLGTLGAGFTVAAAPPASTTCGGVLTATPGTTPITLTGATIPAGGSCTITVPVQVAINAVTGARTNTITQGALQTDQGSNQSAITAPLSARAAISASKAFLPTSVFAGTDTRLTITLAHEIPAVSVTGIAFTDTLPALHLISPTPNLVSTCGGLATAVAGTNTISLSGGSLPAATATCTIAVNVRTPSGSAGAATNTIPIGAVTSTEGFVNPAAASATINRVTATVTLNKSFAPPTVALGGVSTLTVQILNNNPGSIAITAGTLTDNLPAGMAVAAVPAAGTTCGAGSSVTAGANALVASTSGVSLAAGATCQFHFNVVGNVTGNLINTLDSGAFGSAQGVTNPLAASATLAVTGSTDVAISKTDGTATAVPGATTTYTIVATNNGPSPVAGANVLDPGTGLTFTSWTCAASAGAACTAGGSGPINDFVNLPMNGTATYTVVAQIPSGATGTITNTATITTPGSVVDPAPGNNSASDTDALVPTADLSITKTDGVNSVLVGAATAYTIVATNSGPSDADGALVADPAAAGLAKTTVSCVAAGGALCPAGLTIAQLEAGVAILTFPAGGSLTFTVQASVTAAGGSVTNTATVTAPGGVVDPNNANDSASDTDTVSPLADLAVTKTDGTASVNAGTTATYTIVASNAGPSPASGAIVNDPAAAGLSKTSVACAAAGGAACPPGLTIAQLEAGVAIPTFPAGGAITLTVQASVTAVGGSVTNTVSVTPPSGVTDPAHPNDTASDTDTVSATADVSIVKAGPASVNAAAAISYTLTISNAGPSPADGATFADAVPAGITGVGASCGSPSGGAVCGVVNVAGNNVTGSVTTLPSGGSVVITITGTAPSNAATLNNSASVVPPAGTTDPNNPNNTSGPIITNVTPVAALALTKDDGSASYTPGATATYTIVLTNAGPSDASNVTVNDALPAGVALNTNVLCAAVGNASCGTLTGTTGQTSFSATGASVGAGIGNSLTFSVPVTFASSLTAPTLTNTVTATDPASPPTSASDTDGVNVQAALAITKDDGSANYTPGGVATYIVTVTDAGPSDAGNVSVSDPLPAGVLLTAAAGCAAVGNASCGTVVGAIGQSSFSASGAQIAAGGGNALVFTVPVAFAAGLVTNPLVNAASASDPASPTANASDSDTRLLNVSLAVVKNDGSLTYTPGGTAAYTVKVTNGGISDALDISVNDTLPPGVLLTANVTCAPSGNANCGVVTGLAGGSAFGATGARVGAGAADALVFTVPVAFAAGLVTDPLVNTASAFDTASGSIGNGVDSDARAAQVTLGATKTDGSATYTPGAAATYSIVVSNGGVSDALDVLVADALPAGVTLSGNVVCVAAGSASCGTLAGAAGQTSFSATHALVPAGAGNTLSFTVPVTFASSSLDDPLINTVTVNDSASGASGSASDSDARVAQAQLTLTKSDGSANYTPGGTATYTLTAGNNGPSDALNMTLADALPAGVTLSAAISCVASGNASCGTLAGAAGQTSLGATGARIAAGAGNLLTFNAPVAFAPGLAMDPLINTASVSDPASGGSVTASDSDARSVNVSLAISKTDGKATYTPGTAGTYVVMLTNGGISDATNVTIADPMAPDVKLTANVICTATGNATCGVVSGNSGQSTFGATGAQIAAGAGNVLTFTAPVLFGANMTLDPLVNTASASDAVSGASASASDSDVLSVASGLSVAKTDNSATYTPGGNATYVIAVGNAGPSNALNVSVSDPLPVGVVLSGNVTCVALGNAACGTVSGSKGDTSVGATGAQIAAGIGNSLMFNVPVNFSSALAVDPLVNTVTVSDAGGPARTASDSDARVPSAGAVNLSITKTDNSGTYTPGGSAIYVIVVGNAGPADALNISVNDPLPAGVTLVGRVTCVASGNASCGSVTGSAGQTAVATTGARVAAGAGNALTFQLPVTFAATLTTSPLVNTVTVADPSSPTRTASDSDTLTSGADLAIVKTAASQVAGNGAITWKLTISNNGPAQANGTTYSDTLPAGVTSIDATCGSASGGASCGAVHVAGLTVSGIVPTLPVGGSVVITISAVAPTSGTLSNTARVFAPAGVSDPVNANNAASAITLIVAAALPIAEIAVPATARSMLIVLGLLLVFAGFTQLRARSRGAYRR